MRIGFIIADKDELDSINFAALGIEPVYCEYHGMPMYKFKINDKNIEILIVLCGIGLSCAASAAAYLCADKVDAVINAGLSGSISGLLKDEIFICEQAAEHDIDLTPIGYEPGKRPDIPVFFESDKLLVDKFKEFIPFAKSGISASGNGFISSKSEKFRIKEQFDAKCCDMEYSAIALVCNREKIPCISVRKISDSADDMANIDYSSYEKEQTSSLFDLILRAILNFEKSWFIKE